MDLWAVVMLAVGLHDRVCEMLLGWKGSLLLPLMEGLRKVGGGERCIPKCQQKAKSLNEQVKWV